MGQRGADQANRGLLFGLSAYAMWGMFPLYFPLLRPAGTVEILAHRVSWSFVLCAVLMTVLHRWRQFSRAFSVGRNRLLICVAAVLVAVNWGAYVMAVNSAHVVEAALGYYINPLVTVLLGVLVLRERLRRAQWIAIGIGAAAVTVMTIEYGRPPWIALILALTFGGYSLAKNRVGQGVDALCGLTAETGVLLPLSVGYLAWIQLRGASSLWPTGPVPQPIPFGTGMTHLLVLSTAGVVTMVPLLLFASAARRVPLSTIGLMQYLTPTLQFAIGVSIGHESMSAGRWAGFGLVWLALCVLTADTIQASRAGRTAERHSATPKSLAMPSSPDA